MQEAYAAPSKLHWNVKLAAAVWLSVPPKLKLALVLFVGSVGCAVIDVSGGVASDGAETTTSTWSFPAHPLPDGALNVILTVQRL